ncbi:MAG: PHD zinc finger domain-containing protein [Akkermansiaceae bacterium]|nr:PHD zinc finger domain-containing protein [Akkermansiaceae bacterium]
MQIAGKTCDVCQSKVFGILDGRGCRKCDRAYHAACIPDGVRCPHCKADLDLQDREHEGEQKTLREETMRNGRRHFIVAMILATFPIVTAIVYVVMFSDAAPMDKARSVLALMGWCAMWVWMWGGSSAARIIGGFVIFASVALFVSLAFGSFTAEEGIDFFACCLAAVSLLSAGLLVFLKPSISVYLDSQRKTSNS